MPYPHPNIPRINVQGWHYAKGLYRIVKYCFIVSLAQIWVAKVQLSRFGRLRLSLTVSPSGLALCLCGSSNWSRCLNLYQALYSDSHFVASSFAFRTSRTRSTKSSHAKCRPQLVNLGDRPTACNCTSTLLSRKHAAVESRALPRPPSLGFRVLHQNRLPRRRPSLLRQGAHFACSSSGSPVRGRARSVR